MSRSMIDNQLTGPPIATARRVSRRKNALRRNLEDQRTSWVFYGLAVWLFIGMSVQLACGAQQLPVLFIYCGTLLGWLAAMSAGTRSTALMLILFWFTLKTTAVALACKTLVFERWDSQVEHPLSTAVVYFLGYTGLFLAVFAYRKVPWKTGRPITINAFQWRTAAVIFFLSGNVLPHLIGDRSGGIWGALKIYGGVGGAVSVACAVNASLISHPKRVWFHGWALCFFMISMLFAVINTGKEAFVAPAIAYIVPLFISKRIGVAQIAAVAVAGMSLITFIIGPYSDSIRNTGVRDLSGKSRIEATIAGFKSMFDPTTRAEAKAKLETYRNRENAVHMMNGDWGYFERLMTISAGNELISAVDDGGVLGMRLLWGDLSLLLPRMIAPWKPDVSSDDELGHYSGMVSDSEGYIGITFGPFPTLYAMGGYEGVLGLGFCLYFILFYSIGWIERRYAGKLIGGLIFLLLWHSFSEQGTPLGDLYKLLFLALTLWAVRTTSVSGQATEKKTV